MTRRTREEIGKLTPERAEELNRLAARPDSEIDTTDIAEVREIPPTRFAARTGRITGARPSS